MAKKSKDADVKTNVMRLLEQAKIPYEHYTYDPEQAISGVEVAAFLGQDPAHVFKTLVTEAPSRNHYVFVIPVAEELDLKKAAKAAGEKSIAMLKSKDLLPLTGYIHGGCSPIGMKKMFKTFIHETVASQPTFVFSAGKIGFQVEVAPEDLKKIVPYEVTDLIV